MAVLVTGANRGIGAALAAALAARGTQVIATARRAENGMWPLDVTRLADFDALSERLQDRALSLLVCNAGIYNDKGKALSDLDADLWAEAFATNVTGVFLTIRACLPALRRGNGKIAIISSAMGSDTRAPGGSLIYRATKAAVLNLGRNLSRDLDLPVGIYHPGWVQSDMGGPSADLTPAESVAGLIARFDELGPETTGSFLNYDGTALPF